MSMNIPQTPQALKDVYEFIFIALTIILASIVSILRKHRNKQRWLCHLFFVDLFCSVATGFIAYFMLLGFTQNEWLAVFAASYCGHLGPLGIDYIIERLKSSSIIKK